MLIILTYFNWTVIVDPLNPKTVCTVVCQGKGKIDVYYQFLFHIQRREQILDDVEALTSSTNYPWKQNESIELNEKDGVLEFILSMIRK